MIRIRNLFFLFNDDGPSFYPPPIDTSYLLTEDGFNLLQEDGYKIELEEGN